MTIEDVAAFMLQAGREFIPADERRDETVEDLVREMMDDEGGPLIIRMCILAHNAGLRRGLELAKEHICFDDNAHVTGRLGEGRPNWSAAEEAVDKECG